MLDRVERDRLERRARTPTNVEAYDEAQRFAGARPKPAYSPWAVVKETPGIPGPVQVRATIVNVDPSEKDGSAAAWRGHLQLLRQRKAAELSNPKAVLDLLTQRLNQVQ